jgi:hypothetical protein
MANIGVPIKNNNPATAGPIKNAPYVTKLFWELNCFLFS